MAPLLDDHRLVKAETIEVIDFAPPFSSFTYVDIVFGDKYPAIRRLFSLARSHKARTLIVEEISAVGFISEENEEIKQYVADYRMAQLKRISFWRPSFKKPTSEFCKTENCIGYAILKRDAAPSIDCDKWHIFEAVFEKYPDHHNFVPNPMKIGVMLGTDIISVEGVLYAQQNGINKTCSQVALRSLISRIINSDVSYKQINDLARHASLTEFNPADGFLPPSIRAVLLGFGIGYKDFDFTQYGSKERKDFPYQKYIYSGIETGAGALLGFRYSGPGIKDIKRHIISFYGHTFNKDTWAPDADVMYFHVGERLGYVPSEYWTSSFLGHDDNFGPNYCIPRLYTIPENVEYVCELLKPGFKYGGPQAEALALQFLYSALTQLSKVNISQNIWLQRLIFYAKPDIQRIVLRAVATNKDLYISHLSSVKDWSSNLESQINIDILRKRLPEYLWVVEVSIPQVFPANERKLGEIVLRGDIEPNMERGARSHFLVVRLPGLYISRRSDESESQEYTVIPSSIMTHLPLIKL